MQASIIRRFNSSVVRLKGLLPNSFDIELITFQFQCGAIKRTLAVCAVAAAPSFNSSVVRLKAFNGYRAGFFNTTFQFQCGAIKRFKTYLRRKTKQVSIPVWCD